VRRGRCGRYWGNRHHRELSRSRHRPALEKLFFVSVGRPARRRGGRGTVQPQEERQAPVPGLRWEVPAEVGGLVPESAGLVRGELDAVAYSMTRRSAGRDSPPRRPLGTTCGSATRTGPAVPGGGADRIDPSPSAMSPQRGARPLGRAGGPFGDTSGLVCDGRGADTSHLAGHYAGGQARGPASQSLPHSLGSSTSRPI